MTETQEQQEPLDGTAMLAALGVREDDLDDGAVGAELPATEQVEAYPDLPDRHAEPTSAAVADPPEFACQRAVLAAMVEQVMLAVPSRDFYPSLKAIVLDVAEDSLTLTGSNSAITVVSTSMVVRTQRPGRVLVPGSKFAAVVRGCAGPEIRVSVTQSALHISSGGGSWTLRVSSTQDYPPLPELGDLSWVEVDRFAFDRAIAATRYAAGSDESRDHFMQLDIREGQATATDGLRYAQASADLPVELAVQVATSGVDTISKMLANNDAGQFRIADGQYHTVVEIGPSEAPDRLIVAHLMRALPAEARNAIKGPQTSNRDECRVDSAELLAALSRAKPTQDAETGAVALRVGIPDAESVTVESRNRYGDASTEAVGCHFVQAGSDKSAKPRSVVLVRDHLAKAVRAAQRAFGSDAAEEDDEEPIEPGSGTEVLLLLGEARSKSRPAPVLVSDVEGTTQAVLSPVQSDWIS